MDMEEIGMRGVGQTRRQFMRAAEGRAFLDWVVAKNEEMGVGDDDSGAMSFICAQVVGRVTLKQLSRELGLDYGMLWDFVNRTPERVERYRNAQKGLAEWLAGETLEIADETVPETVGVSKVRIDQRNKLMRAWNRERYGDSESVLGVGLENLAVVLQRISERRLREMGQVIEIKEIGNEEVEREESVEEAAEEVLVDGDEVKPVEATYL